MSLEPFLLEIVSCPDKHLPLKPADHALMERLNAAIDKGKLRDKAGRVVGPRLHGALLRDDGELVYPVWDNLPDLMVDAAIELHQLPRLKDGK
jgi:uncharacterized protein YbaR (Trm112 family)